MKERIILYGTGATSKFYLHEEFNKEKFELIAVCDSAPEKWGRQFESCKVISPKELARIDFDVIIVASVFFDDIKAELVQKYNIEADKINNRFYRQWEDIEKRYHFLYNKKGYRQKGSGIAEIRDTDKIVIYTAISGGYDCLKEPEYVDKRCSYICFTDDQDLKSDIWEIRRLPSFGTDFNRSAKQVKVLPHNYLKEYDLSIWVDGAFAITGDLLSLVNIYMLNSGFLSFLHNARGNVYEDATVIINEGFDNENVVINQMNCYEQAGYKDDGGLISGGILFRRHNSPEIIGLMNRWWHEILTHSKRDQLSFNYSAWKEKAAFDVIDMNIYDNKYVKWYPHNKKRGES